MRFSDVLSHKSTKLIFFRICAAVLVSTAIFSCSGAFWSKSAKLDLEISIVSADWNAASKNTGSRFLSPETSDVYVQVKSIQEGGKLLQEQRLDVSLNPGLFVAATGQLDAVPVGIPLEFIAEIRDVSGTVVLSRASAEKTLDESIGQTIELLLLPLGSNPALVNIAPGLNSVTIPANETRILKFSASNASALVWWDRAAFPDLAYQARNTGGRAILTVNIGEAPFAGAGFSLAGSGDHYLLVYNNGIVSSTLPIVLQLADPLLVAVNATGSAYTSADSSTWSGPYATGLTTVNDIAFSRGIFVAAGQTGSNYGLSTSSDGVSWSMQNLGGTSALLMRVQANPAGHFLATAYYGATVELFNSVDGLVWTGPTASGIAGGVVGPAWTGGSWFIANGNLSIVRKSSDGLTWATSGSSGMYQPVALVGLNGRLLVGGGAPANASKQTVTSSDGGLTFGSLISVSTATDYIQAFAANPNTFRLLSVGTGTSAQANYSDNYGASWITSTGTGANPFRSACYWKNGFLIGNSLGGIYSSVDGTAFSASGSAGIAEIRGIAYNQAP